MSLIKCTNCNYEGHGMTYTKGTLFLEIMLWILSFFIWVLFPIAIVYSIWRVSSKRYVCPKCYWENVVYITK